MAAKTTRKYSLFNQGRLVLNWNDLPVLEQALTTFVPSRGSYIRFNETGVNQYVEDKRWDEPLRDNTSTDLGGDPVCEALNTPWVTNERK